MGEAVVKGAVWKFSCSQRFYRCFFVTLVLRRVVISKKFKDHRISNFWTIINVVVGLINIFGLFVWTFPLPFRLCFRLNSNDENYRDALQAAMSLGRLDGVSILLSIIGIMLGLLAIFGFGYIRHRSEKVAEETAKKTADSVMRSTIDQWAKKTRPRNDSENFAPAASSTSKVDFSAVDEEEEIGGKK